MTPPARCSAWRSSRSRPVARGCRCSCAPTWSTATTCATAGLIASLADSAFAVACNSHGTVTVAAGFSIDFLEPGRLGDVAGRRGARGRRSAAGPGSTTSRCAPTTRRPARSSRSSAAGAGPFPTGRARPVGEPVEGQRHDGVGQRCRLDAGAHPLDQRVHHPEEQPADQSGSRSSRSTPSSTASRTRSASRSSMPRRRASAAFSTGCCRAPAAAGSPRAGGRPAPSRCCVRRRAGAARRRVRRWPRRRRPPRSARRAPRRRRSGAGAPCSARGGRSPTWSAPAPGPRRRRWWRRSPAG